MPTFAPARTLTVAVIGNPNTGKSTLFTALTGVHSRIGNYPGVTVEKKTGRFTSAGCVVNLVDLPGTYSLSPRSLDEMVSVDVLLGRQADVGPVDAVLCIVDASNLERNLYVVSQVLDLGLPVVLVLNMWDVAQARGLRIDVDELSRRLRIPVIPCEAHRRKRIDDIRTAVVQSCERSAVDPPRVLPNEFYEEAKRLSEELRGWGEAELPAPLVERLLLDKDGQIERSLEAKYPGRVAPLLAEIRERLKACGCRIPTVEAKARYAWARQVLHGVVAAPPTRVVTSSDRLDRFFTHKFWGLAAFVVIMFVVFQAIYVGATPLMELCEAGQQWTGEFVGGFFAPGPLRSLIVDGVIAGVGGVLVFLPQIVLLFLFIAVLEDCGYMARAAFVMDKMMSKIGLSGKSFVPLMSSFACAVPGIMATRTIENRRDRFVTILVAPLMSCSARAPVYLLMIAAFFPPIAWAGGWITLKACMLFLMTALGALVAIPVAWMLKQTFFRGETPPFVMELPSYKWPSPRIVVQRVWDRASAFVKRAGTLILATNILVWAACYFPESHAEEERLAALIDAHDPSADENLDDLIARRNAESERLLERSILGRAGKALEPAFVPLGWDWRIGIGVLASFPAREVIISTLGTIYSLGSDVDEKNQGLHQALQSATWPDGRPVYTIPVALSVMVFFALCAQCASTLMVIRRETNSWFWPVFTFVYMTVLAYSGALATYQIGSRLGT
jgi:ferrous iron transport protein B